LDNLTPSLKKDTAVCISGQLRALNQTASPIAKYVVQAHDADLFVSTSEDRDFVLIDSLRNATHEGRVFRLNTIPVDFDIKNWYEQQAGENNTWFKRIKKNDRLTFLAGITTKKGGNSYLHYHLHRCSEMIKEQETARGQQYKFVRFLRPDMLYLAEPMPSKFVGENTNTCFCTTGPHLFPRWIGDFEGICDRKGADAYMSTVRIVTQNSSSVSFQNLAAKFSEKLLQRRWRIDPHTWLLLRLREAHVQIKNVINVAYLTCVEEEGMVMT